MQPKSERFEMRLDPLLLDRVDAWRESQGERPSRAEAIRQLVESALVTSSQPKISDGEKLILSMLSELWTHQKVSGDLDPAFVMSAIQGGHYWGLAWRYPGLLHSEADDERAVMEVSEILDMWSFIEAGYDRLTPQDRTIVRDEAGAVGEDVQFRGFDGNSESGHLGIADFLIGDLERFSRFKDRDLNSHIPTSLDAYRRMVLLFEPMRRSLIGRELSAREIVLLLKAMRHPSNN